MVVDKIKLMARATWLSKQSSGFESSVNQTQYREQDKMSHAKDSVCKERRHSISSHFKSAWDVAGLSNHKGHAFRF